MVTGFEDLIPQTTDPIDPKKVPPAKPVTGFEDLIPKRQAKAPTGFEDLIPQQQEQTPTGFEDLIPRGTVTVGQPKGVVGPHGESLITESSMAEIAAGGHGLAPMIGAAQRAGRGRPGYQNIGNIPAGEKTDLPVVTADQLEVPGARAALAKDIAKRTAPGVASTATSIGLSNLMAPISERMAEGGTEHALEEYAKGGGDPSEHATLFGAAAAAGAVAGNVTVSKALFPAAVTGVSATRAVPLAVTRAGRLGQAMVSGAVSQGALGAAGEALTGDESGQRNISSITEAGAKQAVAGAAFGGILGGASEIVGSLAERSAARQLAKIVATPGETAPAPAVIRPPSETPQPSPAIPVPSADGVEYRHAGIGLVPRMIEKIRTGYRRALVTPYAQIETAHPELTNALLESGAAPANATHVGNRAVDWVVKGLSPEQEKLFGQQLVVDNLRAAADSRTASVDAAVLDAPEALPKSSRGLWNSTATPGGKLRAPEEMETEPLLQELLRRTEAQKKYYSDTRKYGPTSAVTQRNEVAIGKIDDILRERDGIEHEAIWNEVKRRQDMGGSGAADDFAFGASSVKPLEFPIYDQPDAKITDSGMAAQRLSEKAAQLADEMGTEVSGEPWYQAAVARHQQYVEQPLSDAAVAAGVKPESLRKPASGYIKLISEDRLTNRELRRAMDANAVGDPSSLRPRSAVGRFFLGEKPELARLFPTGATSPREGPINPASPSTGTNIPGFRRGATRTGSAQTTQGTAREYVTDYRRIIEQDAADKLPRAADNAVYAAVAKTGRELADREEPAIGKKAVQRTVLDENGLPKVQRFEVDRKVANALAHYEREKAMTDETGWRKITSIATRAQIAGMPVEATAHMNTIASIVGSLPGEKDMAGKVLSGVPMLGGKAAAIREMVTMDMEAPASRMLEARLARIGALRVQQLHGGIINKTSNALFGPTGVDVRGRLVLARKYLARKPDASDAELREFITSKLGNYIRPNSGAAVNALQSSGLSAFARFQAARILTSIRLTAGQSDLPTSSTAEKVADVAQTLYRGPIGYALGAEALNRAMTGHSMTDNERGRQDDLQLPFTVGPHERPIYLPVATLNPVVATGMRVTGMRDLIPHPGSPNVGGRIADATRDAINTGLGVLSPLARAASVAATGRTPYMTSDGSMLRVADQGFDQGSNVVNRGKAAIMAANPAVSAFAGQGGDVSGSTLAAALSEDDRFLGGPKAIGARLAAFTLPRLASVGVGGRDNQMSADARDQREYQAAMSDYKKRLRGAAGPKDQNKIIDEAAANAARDGRFDPSLVARELEKYLKTPDDRRDLKREKSVESFVRKHER